MAAAQLEGVTSASKITELLDQLGLSQYHPAFFEAGVPPTSVLRDFIEFNEPEFNTIMDGVKMKPFHAAQFKRAIREIRAKENIKIEDDPMRASSNPIDIAGGYHGHRGHESPHSSASPPNDLPMGVAGLGRPGNQPLLRSMSKEMIIQHATIYGRTGRRTKPLSRYESAINQAAIELALSDNSLVTNKGALFELAKKKLLMDGYTYKRGTSRSKLNGTPSKDEDRRKSDVGLKPFDKVYLSPPPTISTGSTISRGSASPMEATLSNITLSTSAPSGNALAHNAIYPGHNRKRMSPVDESSNDGGSVVSVGSFGSSSAELTRADLEARFREIQQFLENAKSVLQKQMSEGKTKEAESTRKTITELEQESKRLLNEMASDTPKKDILHNQGAMGSPARAMDATSEPPWRDAMRKKRPRVPGSSSMEMNTSAPSASSALALAGQGAGAGMIGTSAAVPASAFTDFNPTVGHFSSPLAFHSATVVTPTSALASPYSESAEAERALGHLELTAHGDDEMDPHTAMFLGLTPSNDPQVSAAAAAAAAVAASVHTHHGHPGDPSGYGSYSDAYLMGGRSI